MTGHKPVDCDFHFTLGVRPIGRQAWAGGGTAAVLQRGCKYSTTGNGR